MRDARPAAASPAVSKAAAAVRCRSLDRGGAFKPVDADVIVVRSA